MLAPPALSRELERGTCATCSLTICFIAGHSRAVDALERNQEQTVRLSLVAHPPAGLCFWTGSSSSRVPTPGFAYACVLGFRQPDQRIQHKNPRIMSRDVFFRRHLMGSPFCFLESQSSFLDGNPGYGFRPLAKKVVERTKGDLHQQLPFTATAYSNGISFPLRQEYLGLPESLWKAWIGYKPFDLKTLNKNIAEDVQPDFVDLPLGIAAMALRSVSCFSPLFLSSTMSAILSVIARAFFNLKSGFCTLTVRCCASVFASRRDTTC